MFATLTLMALALAQGPGELPKAVSAQAQLNQAKEVKKTCRGTKGAARVQALDQACEAFGAVMQYWPQSGAITAEAAFRQGEIHRTLGRPGPARGAFLVAVEQGVGTAFCWRGQLEIGHLHRRALAFPKALEAYAKVFQQDGVELRYLNDAREWQGRVHLELEQWDKATAVFHAWAQAAEDPVDAVHAGDWEARALAGAGRLEDARAKVVEVRSSLQDLASEPTKEAARLRKALERMKAPDAILAAEEEAAERAAAAAAAARTEPA